MDMKRISNYYKSDRVACFELPEPWYGRDRYKKSNVGKKVSGKKVSGKKVSEKKNPEKKYQEKKNKSQFHVQRIDKRLCNVILINL